MSIKVMSDVWRESAAKGSELLLLLAIADYADDNGVAWPGIETLAQKIRMTPRSVQNLTDELIKSGELIKASRLKLGGSNLYIVLIGLTPNQLRLAQERVAHLGGDVKFSTPEIQQEELLGGDETVSSTGDEIATTSDPSFNHQLSHKEPICADAQPKKKRGRPPKEQTPKEHPPQAIRVFNECTARYPNKTLWPGIVQMVGEAEESLDRWRRTCIAYVACGWNPVNVKGMLRFFANREIPGENIGKGNGNGSTGGNKRIILQGGHIPRAATPEEFYGTPTVGELEDRARLSGLQGNRMAET